MKSKRWFEVVVLWALLCSTAPVYAAIPLLHVDGNKIKDPNENVVVLRGISLIDLGFLQDWESGAINMINRITNKNDPCGTSPGWHPKIIRIPIAPPDSSPPNWPHKFNPDNNDLYNLLRTVVNYCASKDLYVIIDWHYIDDTIRHVETTSEFWQFMAPRFAADNHVMFELYNEPINSFGSETVNWLKVRDDMQTWINIVRKSAPDNIILVAGPIWSQAIGPAAGNPLTGDDIVIVSHIYPGHWRAGYPSWYTNQITTCAAVYPIMMTEWGFSQSGSPDPQDLLNGTIAGYGQPLMDFREQYGIGNTAWVASYDWGPPMFWRDAPYTWNLRIGEGEMGGFTKDKLYDKRDANQPGGVVTNRRPIAYITSPLTDDVFQQGDDIVIEANAFDREGSVTKVEFYQGSTKLSEDTNAPYSYAWNNVPAGRYRLTVKATDNNNWTKTSVQTIIGVHSGDASGSILREWWTGIGSGTAVNNLTSDINYPANPTGRELITKFEGPINYDANYGARIRGYLYPPAGGNYTFWIASDDSSELWLSTDAEPNHISKIAYVSGWTNLYEWTKYGSQQSSPKSLTAGQKYYIEVLHKEGTGGDNVAVAWEGPGITQQVIDGVYLSPCFFDFRDFSRFAAQWSRTSCVQANAWCSGADYNRDGSVLFEDLQAFADYWLLGAE